MFGSAAGFFFFALVREFDLSFAVWLDHRRPSRDLLTICLVIASGGAHVEPVKLLLAAGAQPNHKPGAHCSLSPS
jgi:hypothetical protein